MHPDQFVLLNAPDEGVFQRSIADLVYQAQVLDLMGLDRTAKVQIHVGGVYGDKTSGMDRFAEKYELLDPAIRNRLVIENDERLYTIEDCLALHERTGIPVIADSFHHALHNNGERFVDLLNPLRATWKAHDGIPMVDYSSQEPGKRVGAHAEHIVPEDFRQFLHETRTADFDIMLEIKDKEKSALSALDIARDDPRGHEEKPPMRDLIRFPHPDSNQHMDLLTPAVIGIGLSMDCFAVSLAIGTTTKTRLIPTQP